MCCSVLSKIFVCCCCNYWTLYYHCNPIEFNTTPPSMNTNGSNGSVDQLQVETSQHIQKDPRKLTNLNEILSCLSWYQSEEATLSNSLAGLLSDRASIADSLRRLEALVPHLDDLCLESLHLARKVSSTATTADRVGGRVRALDREMSRVSQAAERVGQVMELKVILCMRYANSFFGLHYSSLPFLNYKLALSARTGSRRLDTVLVLCRCPSKLFLAPSLKLPWYVFLGTVHTQGLNSS